MAEVMKTPTVPTWNGGAGTWEKYQQDVMNYVDGMKWEDRYLCGPRLVARLTGAAATACIGRPRRWLSNSWGADYLLEYLQKNVMRQPVEDVGHYMEEYFVKLRRRRGEGMAEYCLRVHESYQRLRVALARTVRKNGKDQFMPVMLRGTASRVKRALPRAMRKRLKCETGKFPKLSGTDRRGTATADGKTGGLDGGEIAAVIGSCRGDFTVDNVESALRTQWPSDENLKDRDYRKSKFIRQQVAAAAFYGDDAQTWGDGDERDNALAVASTTEGEEEGVDDEAYATAITEEEEAYAQFQASQRRLQDARQQINKHRTSRKFFGSGGGQRSDGRQGPCLKCGGAHRTGGCPDKADPKLSQNRPAPGRGGGDSGGKLHGFILMAEYDARSDDETELQVEELGNVVDFDDPEVRMAYVVERATEKGHGIMDRGAAKTTGGIEAVETLNEILISRGHPPMEVDLQDLPVYKFGNGEVKRVLCRVKFTLLVQGEYVPFFVHAINAKGIPILVSIETLNNLGAIVDFDAACGIFKKIDPFRMISFPRSRTGHLLIDLTCDLLGGTGIDGSSEKDYEVLKYIYWLTEYLYGISNRICESTE
ncbi:unnamed protein product [Prorocentrum cordatum]|uniref:Uncharacterized protein n=1 Tax=Prorocentrum cordatum TaxID=2364126 RepID=A0ABN9TNG0_9DINO|nr:unnamed protein product [Polarella glacialis]